MAALAPQDRADQVRRLFDEALDLAPAERTAFLNRACADRSLRREVASLLDAFDHVDSTLHTLDHPYATDPLLGRAVAQYLIIERLGGGGMGVVYKARDTRLDRTVALKFLPPAWSHDEEAKARFLHEAHAAAALDHPRICTIHEIGETTDGRLFLVMTYYPGETLKQKMKQGPLPIEEAVDYAVQVAEGLAAAHTAGIVHRDVKPANIMVTADGQVKLLDFGLAKTEDVHLTQPGTTLGTMPYMSPEQTRGEAVDARSDLWALGVVLYELLTGEHPFRGEHAETILYAIRHDEPTPVTALRPGVPTKLSEIVERLLQKDPAARFPNAEEALAALHACHGVADQTERLGRDPARRLRWYPWAVLAGGILVLGSLSLWLRGSDSPVAPSAGPGVAAVAVLPLENVSGEVGQESFADGMTIELITTLTKIEELRTISYRSMMHFKDSDAPVSEIAKRLNVGYIVEGTVLQTEGRVRINAQLIDATTDTPVWGDRFEREMSSVLALQQEVALAIARQIAVTLTPADRERLRPPPEVDPEAFLLYLKGAQARYREADTEAAAYFEQSLSKDPGFALTHAGLASASAVSSVVSGSVEEKDRARQHMETALVLDPRLSEAHVARGLVLELFDRDYPGAETAFRDAIRLNPSDAFAHLELGLLLLRKGAFEEARYEVEHALLLNPLSPRFQIDVALVHYYSRRYDEAIEAAERTLALDSTFVGAYALVTLAMARQERYDQAIAAVQQGLALGCPCRPILGYVYALSGRTKEARDLLETEEALWRQGTTRFGYGIASIYAALGEREQALTWLERYVATGGVPIHLGIDQTFESLRTEPRFQTLLETAGL